ncbi:hypothetical protein U1872_03725 [Sphingomonas sp. RB3P16]|uniref:hypothetical protein n=1 Tax=Parasphingomonas frigoris TaxID=3096163 RepID=UPI002FC69548
MTMISGIDRIGAVPALGGFGANPPRDAQSIAASAIGEIGQRVLAWVGASGGSADAAGLLGDATGVAARFSPEVAALARGGDIYGLGALAGEITAQLGATPTQEGDLCRALQDFTRAAVVQVAGLSGAAGDRQIGGIRDAFAAAIAHDAVGGIDGVVARLDTAAGVLTRQNG